MKTLSEILDLTKFNEETFCMEWQRCFNTDGYPRMGVTGNSNVKVHRLVYELANNKDITGYVVRHTCDNPKCINPEHLILGDNKANMRDRDERNPKYVLMTRELLFKVKELLATKKLTQKEIALLTGLTERRVSDINMNRYNDEGLRR